MASLQDRIWTIATNPANAGGFTRYVYGLDVPVQGFCVAYSDTQNCFGQDGMKRALAHAQTHAQVIGGWLHANQFFFDSVRIYQTDRAAIEAAIREGQIGYFDLVGGYQAIRANGQLLPQYQQLLNAWNATRQAAGMPPIVPYG